MNPQIERLIRQAVDGAEDRLKDRIVVSVDAAIAHERRACDREHEGIRKRLELAEREVLIASERIRALERVEDHRSDYAPPELLRRLEGIRGKLRAIQ